MQKLSLLLLSLILFTACLNAGPDASAPVEVTEEVATEETIEEEAAEVETAEEETTEEETTKEEATEEEVAEEEVVEDETAEEEVVEEETAEEEAVAEAANAEYIAYTKETYDSLIGQSPVVLYFHADWCPVCVKLNSDISGAIANFPAGSTILKLDFDQEIELRQEYGVTVQSTLITLNAAGEVIEKLNAPSNEDLIAAINKTL